MVKKKATKKVAGFPDVTYIGDQSGFHVEVAANFGEDPPWYHVVIWPSNHGVTLVPSIRLKETALALGQHLYDVLLPEYEAEQIRRDQWLKKFTEEQAKRPKPKPPRVLKNAPVVDVVKCPECGALMLEANVSDERVYECGECSVTAVGPDGRQCEQCHKFTAKISDTSCPECDGPMDEAEKTRAQKATDGTWVEKPK